MCPFIGSAVVNSSASSSRIARRARFTGRGVCSALKRGECVAAAAAVVGVEEVAEMEEDGDAKDKALTAATAVLLPIEAVGEDDDAEEEDDDDEDDEEEEEEEEGGSLSGGTVLDIGVACSNTLASTG